MDIGIEQSVRLRNFNENTKKSYLNRAKRYLENNNTAWDIFISNAVRVVFLLEAVFCIYYTTEITRDRFYLFLIALLINILVGSVFVSFSKSGKEYYW